VVAEFVMIVVGGLKFGRLRARRAGDRGHPQDDQTVNFAHGAFVLAGAYAPHRRGLTRLRRPFLSDRRGLLAAVKLAVLRPIRQADMFAVIHPTIFIGIGLSEVYRSSEHQMLGVPNRCPGRPSSW
jgi:hypothetical protein